LQIFKVLSLSFVCLLFDIELLLLLHLQPKAVRKNGAIIKNTICSNLTLNLTKMMVLLCYNLAKKKNLYGYF